MHRPNDCEHRARKYMGYSSWEPTPGVHQSSRQSQNGEGKLGTASVPRGPGRQALGKSHHETPRLVLTNPALRLVPCSRSDMDPRDRARDYDRAL